MSSSPVPSTWDYNDSTDQLEQTDNINTGSIVVTHTADDGTVTTLDEDTGSGGDYQIDDQGSAVVIIGLEYNDSVTFNAANTTGFDSVQISNVAGEVDSIPDNASFDVGGFGFEYDVEGSSIALSFNLDVTDNDNSTDTGTLLIDVIPDGDPVNATGEPAGVAIIGGDGVDTILAEQGNIDIITGNAGVDIIDVDMAGDISLDTLVDGTGEDDIS
ncbi:hypothetical protein ACFLYW_04400, partial [Thermodesulfobacteriota bacterium]